MPTAAGSTIGHDRRSARGDLSVFPLGRPAPAGATCRSRAPISKARKARRLGSPPPDRPTRHRCSWRVSSRAGRRARGRARHVPRGARARGQRHARHGADADRAGHGQRPHQHRRRRASDADVFRVRPKGPAAGHPGRGRSARLDARLRARSARRQRARQSREPACGRSGKRRWISATTVRQAAASVCSPGTSCAAATTSTSIAS